uniref:Uncharacterized protein n=1 Tax=Rhizophora mucronata TaxID=61149 RepID=A0A2P2NRN9_RHIMU
MDICSTWMLSPHQKLLFNILIIIKPHGNAESINCHLFTILSSNCNDIK